MSPLEAATVSPLEAGSLDGKTELRERVRRSTKRDFLETFKEYRHRMGWDTMDDYYVGLLQSFKAAQLQQ